jgi:NAD(P)-dependent dehydrogenase (short-subunit alcohol dehydrogenase family)
MTRSILITGCSSGIGYDAAHTLAKRGWRVFATCRQEKDCERLRGEGLESFRLDYSDEASIREAAAEAFARTGGTLDALFNNGAYAIPGATEDLPRDALRAIYEVNLFGQFDLIRQVLPSMKRRGEGRIVNNSSILGFVPAMGRGAYVSTKYAMEGLTDVLRLENHGNPIHIILIEPGPIRTKIRVNSIPHFEKWIDWENSLERERYETKLIPRMHRKNDKNPFELDPSAVTAKLIHALESPKPKPRYYVTTPTRFMGLMRRILPTRALDAIIRRE